ncbi:MAG TPA: plasmid pRiA4b ORF-3 family protein [bacterium]
MKPFKTKSIFQLKVTLKDINPPLWRQLLVSPSTTLFELHDVLQLAMGWTDSHLHEFIKGDDHFQPPDPNPDPFNETEYTDSRDVPLSRVLFKPGDHLDYLYDFGDAWEHDIVLEEILSAEPLRQYPLCLAGARACPPEDCGSTTGYENLVEAMKNPNHPDREDLITWFGRPYDPEEFDLGLINRDLEDPEKAWTRKIERFS